MSSATDSYMFALHEYGFPSLKLQIAIEGYIHNEIRLPESPKDR